MHFFTSRPGEDARTPRDRPGVPHTVGWLLAGYLPKVSVSELFIPLKL
jgi:hypothetical protein